MTIPPNAGGCPTSARDGVSPPLMSVCITAKNRSRVVVGDRELQLFPNCVRSLAESVPEGVACELVVSDWGSDDWPLEQWIHETAGSVPVRVVPIDGTFNRGRGRNVAAAAATGTMLFFTDTDALFSSAVFLRGAEVVAGDRVFFPVRWKFHGPEHDDGHWRHEGFGNCVLRRTTFAEVKGWAEYDTWGREDDDFYERVGRISEIVREEVPGFCHQWHPDTLAWKDREGRLGAALHAIAQVVPSDHAFVLVDEGRFGVTSLDGRTAVPFPERDGRYAGRPDDDISAILEVERLRGTGAGHVAFLWTTFDWFEEYALFAKYVSGRFPLVVDDDNLKLFAF
jgi:glycosyltransferase involved in cell wall biosynthesis